MPLPELNKIKKTIATPEQKAPTKKTQKEVKEENLAKYDKTRLPKTQMDPETGNPVLNVEIDDLQLNSEIKRFLG